MNARRLLSIFFFISGFTALLYQTVWMRLSLARFGVNTSVVATVLAVFMLGLAAGSVFATRWVRTAEVRFGLGPLRIYGIAELVVGIGGLVVPLLLTAGRDALLALGPQSGGLYTMVSTAVLATILLPFCTAMGVTFPAAIAFLRQSGAAGEGHQPFSALYLANVSGALCGAVTTPLFFIELFGFLAPCRAASVVNVAIALAAFAAFPRSRFAPMELAAAEAATTPGDPGSRVRMLALFATGFSTMGMEVVWMRMYPTIVGTFVYSYAAVVAIYLFATTLGSAAYRLVRRRNLSDRLGLWLPWLCASAFLPLFVASVKLPEINGFLLVFAGLAPFCSLLGFVTPALIDREAGDDAARVGRAYGINLLGCLLGPLVAGFALLPAVGTKLTVIALALPLFLVASAPEVRRETRAIWSLAAVAVAVGVLFTTTLFEDAYPKARVRRDHVATVLAMGAGTEKLLFVNGVGMTTMSTVTKLMAHFPAAHLAPAPGRRIDALVICFGMGTSFRSLASWGANVTAVELVPSVPELFGYYFPEGPELVRASHGSLRIVSDDGRRFLDRSRETYDLITIDPPPPVEAAGSGLLYSKEFYASAKRRMRPGAILQTWLPGGDAETVAGMVLSVLESFTHVRVLGSVQGDGYHVIASNEPIPMLSSRQIVARMPEAARRDLREWLDVPPHEIFQRMLANEYITDSLLIGGRREATVAISDDRPVNEFYFMRRFSLRAPFNLP